MMITVGPYRVNCRERTKGVSNIYPLSPCNDENEISLSLSPRIQAF